MTMQSAPQLSNEEKIRQLSEELRHLYEERRAQKKVIMNLRQKLEMTRNNKKKNLLIENDIISSENEAQKEKIQDLSSRNVALVMENGTLRAQLQNFKEVKEQDKFQTEQFRLLNNQLQKFMDVQFNGRQKEINEKKEDQRFNDQLKMKKENREAIEREEALCVELETVKTALQKETTEKESMRLSYEETLRSQKRSYESQLHQATMIQIEYCKHYDDVKIELSKMNDKREMELFYKEELTAQRRLSENQRKEAGKREEALRLELEKVKYGLQQESREKEHMISSYEEKLKSQKSSYESALQEKTTENENIISSYEEKLRSQERSHKSALQEKTTENEDMRLAYEQKLKSQERSHKSALQKQTTENENMISSYEQKLRSQKSSYESELHQATLIQKKNCGRYTDAETELTKMMIEKGEMELSYKEELTAQRTLSENQRKEADKREEALRLEIETLKSALQQETSEKNEDKLRFEEKLRAKETFYEDKLQKAEQSKKDLKKQFEKSRTELRRTLLDCEEMESSKSEVQSSDESN